MQPMLDYTINCCRARPLNVTMAEAVVVTALRSLRTINPDAGLMEKIQKLSELSNTGKELSS